MIGRSLIDQKLRSKFKLVGLCKIECKTIQIAKRKKIMLVYQMSQWKDKRTIDEKTNLLR